MLSSEFYQSVRRHQKLTSSLTQICLWFFLLNNSRTKFTSAPNFEILENLFKKKKQLLGNSSPFHLSHAASTFARLPSCALKSSILFLHFTNVIVAFSELERLANCFKLQIMRKLIYVWLSGFFFFLLFARKLRNGFAIFKQLNSKIITTAFS